VKRKMFSAPVKAKAVLSARRAKSDAGHEALTDRLYQRIRQFEVELDRLKKKGGLKVRPPLLMLMTKVSKGKQV